MNRPVRVIIDQEYIDAAETDFLNGLWELVAVDNADSCPYWACIRSRDPGWGDIRCAMVPLDRVKILWPVETVE